MMARYIDAELFDKKLAMEVYLADDEDFTKAFVRGMELVKKAENEIPTADVQEVRHGHWIEDKETGCLICSECGHFTDEIIGDMIERDGKIIHRSMNPIYCSKCGAKMDGKEESEDEA